MSDVDILIKLNVDFAGVRIGNNRKCFLRKIDGATAAGRAVVDDSNDNALAGAGVGIALVSGAGARDFVLSVTRRSIVPNGVARRRDHHSVVGVAVAG